MTQFTTLPGCWFWTRFEGPAPSTIGVASLLVVAGAGLLVAGCHKATRAGAKTAAQIEGTRSTEIVHEECKVETSQEKLDANGDGRPEISIATKNNRPHCQAVDLNQDGVIDVYAYFDAGGGIRRREYAYSRDARISEIRLYKSGMLSEVQQSTANEGRLDTWHFFKNGKRVRTERDSDGDGVIDEWWEYPNAARPGCPTMYSDGNRDAKPDPGSEVDLCEHGYVPPEREEYRYKSPDFERPGSIPTEAENRKAEPADEPQGGDDAK